MGASVLATASADAQTADELSDDIDAKREEAAAIATEVEQLGSRMSMAVEEYRQAEVALDEADATLFETRRRVEGLRVRFDSNRARADERIVAMYRGESSPDPMSFLDARDVRELGVRQHYAGVIAQRDRRVLDEIAAQRQDLQDQERSLAEEREAVARQADELKARQAEVETLIAERQAALDRAQGELASLVEEEQHRRAAEEEARARAEAQRRAEDETRRRAATSTTSSTTTTLPADPSDPSAPTTAPPEPEPEPAPADVPPVHPRAGEAVQTAVNQVGKPYQWGANGPDSFDCSGLTSYAWASVGVRIPRSSGLQKEALPPVPFDAIQPGDLLFFGDPVHHVGISMGDGKMVNAPYTGTEVRIDSIYRRDFSGAGRPG